MRGDMNHWWIGTFVWKVLAGGHREGGIDYHKTHCSLVLASHLRVPGQALLRDNGPALGCGASV